MPGDECCYGAGACRTKEIHYGAIDGPQAEASGTAAPCTHGTPRINPSGHAGTRTAQNAREPLCMHQERSSAQPRGVTRTRANLVTGTGAVCAPQRAVHVAASIEWVRTWHNRPGTAAPHTNRHSQGDHHPHTPSPYMLNEYSHSPSGDEMLKAQPALLEAAHHPHTLHTFAVRSLTFLPPTN